MNYSNRRLATLLSGAFLVTPLATAVAGPTITVDAVCPPNVSAATQLEINITVENRDFSESFTFSRFMTALAAGSRRNTLGMLGVYGPFPYNLSSSVTIPPRGQQVFTNVPVISSVPGTLVGQMVGATASVVDSEGQLVDVAYCVSEVQ
jgi:hypothetical protein